MDDRDVIAKQLFGHGGGKGQGGADIRSKCTEERIADEEAQLEG